MKNFKTKMLRTPVKSSTDDPSLEKGTEKVDKGDLPAGSGAPPPPDKSDETGGTRSVAPEVSQGNKIAPVTRENFDLVFEELIKLLPAE